MSGNVGDLLQLFQTPQRIAQSVGNTLAIDNSGQSWMGSGWQLRLQPGSWRGIGFVLDAGDTHAGRRVAIHEYPYRDTAWAEDLGKLPRRFNIQAFLTGEDVYSQRDAFVGACEQPGSGTLVHPTMGSVECVLLDFAVIDRRERGRVVEVAMQFMLASDVRYPGTAIATGDAVTSAAGLVNSAAAGDLGAQLAGLPAGLPAMARNVTGFTNAALGAVNDATRIFNSVRGLAGFFGRFDTGSRMTLMPASVTVANALSAATTARTAVSDAVSLVQHTVGAL